MACDNSVGVLGEVGDIARDLVVPVNSWMSIRSEKAVVLFHAERLALAVMGHSVDRQ